MIELPDLSIITVNYNGYPDTCDLIDSLYEVVKKVTFEIIVVDNASKRDEALLLHQKYPAIRVIRSEQNLGFAGGNNLGLKEASGKDILLINNDTYITADHFDSLIDRLHSNPTIGMVCPLIRFAAGTQPIQFYGYTPLSPITLRNKGILYGQPIDKFHLQAHTTPYAHGAAMLFRKELIQEIGYMPEIYFLYYEEMDWSCQLARKGLQIWVEPACTVFHKESQSTGQHSPLKSYYMMRNRLLFAYRNQTNPAIRLLSHLYLIGIVGTKECISAMAHNRFDLCKSTLKGIKDYLLMNKNKND